MALAPRDNTGPTQVADDPDDPMHLEGQNWLAPLVQDVCWCFERSTRIERSHIPVIPADHSRFALWLDEMLTVHGFGNGMLPANWAQSKLGLRENQRDECGFLDTLRHSIELLLEMRQALGWQGDPTSVESRLTLMLVLALHVGEEHAAHHFHALSGQACGGGQDTERDPLGAATDPAVHSLGNRLRERYLQAWQPPLRGLPLLHALIYADTRQFLELGHVHLCGGGGPDLVAARVALDKRNRQTILLAESIFCMARADRTVSAVECRLVEQVLQFGHSESARLCLLQLQNKCLLNVKTLAEGLPDPCMRRLLFQQLVLHAHFEPGINTDERRYLDSVIEAFGFDEGERLLLESSALGYLENHSDLTEARTFDSTVHRYRSCLATHIERAIRRNSEKIVQEIRETGELAQLLARCAQHSLSTDEKDRMHEQIIDLCKIVPALAVFALPGGALLLPILHRLLPFDLMPSSFQDKEERF